MRHHATLVLALLLVTRTGAIALHCKPLSGAVEASFDRAYLCQGVPRWQVYPYVWAPIHVNISCTKSTVSWITALWGPPLALPPSL